MLRYLTILKHGKSGNQRMILPEMPKNGIGVPSTIWKVNLIKCTWTIHPTSMMSGTKKNIGREKLAKKAGPTVQGMVKTQLKIAEVEKSSICPHRCSLPFSLNVEYPRLTLQKWLDSTTSQARGPGWCEDHKMVTDGLLFNFSPLFLLVCMARKVPGLTIYTFQQGSLPYRK